MPHGAETVEVFERESPDLVVFEIGPPGKDGREAMERMIARLPETPVVLNSASSSDRIPLRRPAPEACIVKSSDTGELRSKIRELLDSPMMPGQRRIGGGNGEASGTAQKERTGRYPEDIEGI